MCSSLRRRAAKLEAAICRVTVAPSTAAVTVTRADSCRAAPSRMSLSQRLTSTAVTPATTAAPIADITWAVPALRPMLASSRSDFQVSATEPRRL